MKPWLTRKEAAAYLCWSVLSVDRRLVPMGPKPEPGKMRYAAIRAGGQRQQIRILAEDVYRLLPLPPGATDFGRREADTRNGFHPRARETHLPATLIES